MLKVSFLLLCIVFIYAVWYHICSSTNHYNYRSEYYMAFIKAQKIVYDDSGRIISGSASVVDAVYVHTGNSAHSRQQVREKLGRVLYLSEDRKTGVFLSPTRGLIEYDALSDSFSSVEYGMTLSPAMFLTSILS